MVIASAAAVAAIMEPRARPGGSCAPGGERPRYREVPYYLKRCDTTVQCVLVVFRFLLESMVRQDSTELSDLPAWSGTLSLTGLAVLWCTTTLLSMHSVVFWNGASSTAVRPTVYICRATLDLEEYVIIAPLGLDTMMAAYFSAIRRSRGGLWATKFFALFQVTKRSNTFARSCRRTECARPTMVRKSRSIQPKRSSIPRAANTIAASLGALTPTHR